MNEPAKATTRQRILITVALAVLSIYAAFSVSDAHSAASRLADARADLVEVSQKLSDIQRLERAPRIAALDLEAPDEIVNRVAAALDSAGLPQSALSNQTSSEPVRIERSDFKLRAVTLYLHPCTMSQILRFCDALRDEETGTIVRDLTLSAPRSSVGGESQETWEAEMILTQMIFSPTSR